MENKQQDQNGLPSDHRQTVIPRSSIESNGSGFTQVTRGQPQRICDPPEDYPTQTSNCKKDNRVLCIVSVVVVIVLSAATVAVVLYLIDRTDDEPNITVEQYLGEDTKLEFHISAEDMNTTETILVNPPVMFDDGQSITLSLNQHELVKRSASNDNDTWFFDYNPKTGKLTLHGPRVKCSSNGTYVTQFIDINGTSILVVNITLTVKNHDLCRTFDDNEGYTGRLTTSMSSRLAKLPNAVTCKSQNVDDKDEMPGKEAEIVLGDTCDPITCSLNCTRKFGPDFYFADKSRCDKFLRCSYGDLQPSTYTSEGTYFNAQLGVCSQDHSYLEMFWWCNDDGSVKVDADLTDHVCKFDNNG